MVAKSSFARTAKREAPAPPKEPLSKLHTNPVPVDQFDRERMGIAAKE